MKQILKNLSEIENLLDYYTYDKDIEYVKSQFTVSVEVNEGVLIYNILTCEMILIENDERDTGIQNGYLSKRWFLFPEDIDQYSFCKAVKHIYRNMYRRKSITTFSTYVIMTTTNCNARCWYCYETDCKKQDMDSGIASDVAEYIIKTASGKFHIQWFGGEPLYNKDAINTICRKLKSEEMFFTSSIVTNGYLACDCTEEEIKLWNLRSAQITLDGTEKTYNATKDYIYIDDNPFEIVLDNIEYLLKNNVKVGIRMNISPENAGDLHNLIDLMSDRFGGYERFSAYSHPVFDCCGHGFPDGSADDYISIEEHLQEARIDQDYPIDVVRMTSYCMADGKSGVVIAPDGNLTLCEHYSDTELVGDIYHDKLNRRVIAEWEKQYTCDDCKKCALLPQCAKIYKCPSAACTEADRKHTEYLIKKSMIKAYKNFLDEEI